MIEKQKILEAEILLVEQQKLLLKEKQKLIEASKSGKIIDDDVEMKQNVDSKESVQSTLFENPTEDDIKCLTKEPKPSSEKKKD